MEVSYDRLSLRNRFAHLFRLNGKRIDQERGLIETIDQLRRSSKAKNEAYRILEKTNQALLEAKARLDDYAGELERMVEERTRSLRETQEELMRLNRDLETKVKSQVLQLEKYNELRRYLSPTIAEKVMTTGQDLSAVSHRKMMTVVFTDIRGFSALTDSLEPEEISHLLNHYLSEMIQVVHEHDGTLNKILGDGVMVFFGDPLPMEDHALRAVLMAVDMQKRIGNLRDEWLQFGHGLGVGIGINTGFMTVGNIGSETYRDYTVIGNQVNIAARLEKLAGPGQIILSQRTYSQVKEKVEVEEVGPVQVKGIHSPIKTYNVKIF
jgi:adenylate cyclase